MENRVKVMKLEDTRTINCPDAENIRDREINASDLINDNIIPDKVELPHNLFINTCFNPNSIKFISYRQFENSMVCEDNKRIINDVLDVSPIVPALHDRSPISLGFILKGNKKKKF